MLDTFRSDFTSQAPYGRLHIVLKRQIRNDGIYLDMEMMGCLVYLHLKAT